MSFSESSTGNYVYATRAPLTETYQGDTTPAISTASPVASDIVSKFITSTTLDVRATVQPLSQLTATQRCLLHHFVTCASSIISCHSEIQSVTCKGLVPMAMQVPSLFSAIMALSQIHKDSLNLPGPEASGGGGSRLIQHYGTSSMQSLRQELQNSNTSKVSTLATILTLCMCEIHTGGNKSKSWRVHFDGARALLSAMGTPSDLKNAVSDDDIQKFLERWYISIEALAALTSKGLPTGQLRSLDIEMTPQGKREVFLDDYFGFTTDLVFAFREIGAAAWERRRMNLYTEDQVKLSEHDFQKVVTSLEASIKQMMVRDGMSPPSFYPGVAAKLSHIQMLEFYVCNKAYQHTALIHLYRRVKQLPSASIQVQESVKAIIDCASQIEPKSGLSPWIVLLTPLFTAGYEAIGADRLTVEILLRQLYVTVRIRNIQQALEYLQTYWSKIDNSGDKEWLTAQGKHASELCYGLYRS